MKREGEMNLNHWNQPYQKL